MTEALHHFAGSYFHQDWDIDADSPRGLVRFFARMEPSFVEPVLNDLKSLSAENLSEEDLADVVVGDLAIAYDPRLTGRTVTAFINELRMWFDEELSLQRNAGGQDGVRW